MIHGQHLNNNKTKQKYQLKNIKYKEKKKEYL